MNPYKKLIGNSALFAIGNMGSKIVSILLVPLYTYHLSTSEYGSVDLVTTTSRMLLPIISLSIFDAVLRYVMDKNNDIEKVITNGIVITLFGTVLALLSYPLLKLFNIMDELLLYTIVILVLQSFQSLFAQFCRAIEKIRIFALNGILMTLVMGLMNIILLVYLEMGISGYLLSIVISNLISIVYFIIAGEMLKYIDFRKIDRALAAKMIKYSVPLIPNAFMWWLMNASNRYFVFYFVGSSANGLFAVANKIPSLLSVFTTIFSQAWQLSAIEEYESENKSGIYTNVFTYYSIFMFLGASGILMFLKITTSFLVEKNYYNSWEIVPPLLLGVIFSSFSSFLGTNYIAAKQTKGVFSSSVIGGILSLILNMLFVPKFGVIGAGVSTMISFLAIWLIRVYDTRRFIQMKFDWQNIIINLIFLSIQTVILFMNFQVKFELTIQAVLFIILLFINKRLFIPFFKIIKNNSKR